MAAYRRVYDSPHLQADCQAGISSGTLRWAVEYGLPLPFYTGATWRIRCVDLRGDGNMAGRYNYRSNLLLLPGVIS